MKIKLTSFLLIFMSVSLFTSCGESKEAVANDLADEIKKSAEIVDSGNKDAISKFVENNSKLVERAKAVGIDLEDPSTYPENLKKAFEDKKSSLLSGAKDTAKDYIDENSDLPEPAKNLMKNFIDSKEK